jgi:hypothetical protein
MPVMKVEQRNIDIRENWDQLFLKYFGDHPKFNRSTFADSSVVLTPEYDEKLIRLCTVLNKACKAIVHNYFSDDRIRKYYQLDQTLEDLLKRASGKAYNVGFYRPDLLYDLNKQAKICEIGARYSLNGWILSHYLKLISREIDRPGSPVSVKALNLDDLIEDLYNELAPLGRIALVQDDEKGNEIFYVQKEFAKRGLELLSVNPRELMLQHDIIHSNGQPFLQFILEMDREELKKIDSKVMDKLIEQGSYFNDIRTLILVHDKRVLAVMYDSDIMSSYLSEDEYHFLKDYLIPSFVITDPTECAPFIHTDQNLILKLNSGGRGIGAYIKNDCTVDEWEAIIQTHWNEYLIQHFVVQKEFYDAENSRQIHLVGMLLCKDDKTYGTGIFRGSDETVVNVHQGRAQIYAGLEQ